MFKSLTIGKRIAAGFGFIVAFLAAVGGITYHGVDRTVKNAEEVIVGNQLDAILAQKEVDHLNWVNQVNRLLTDKTCTQLSVQTDDHKCGFGEWLYGEGRKEAERRVPSIAPLLKEIETPHAELHKSAIAIGETFRREHAGLRVTLANLHAEHIKWVSRCAEALLAESGGVHTYETSLRDAVRQAESILSECATDESLGNEQARQAHALLILRSLRCGPKGEERLWVADTDAKIVLYPDNPELEGETAPDTADASPKKLVEESLAQGRQDNGGFFLSMGPTPAADTPATRLCFAKTYQRWNWIVGAGVQLDASNPALLKRAQEFVGGRPFKLDVECDPAKCAFGEFLANPETEKMCAELPELKTALDASREPHRRLHETATKIQQLISERRLADAEGVFQTETQHAAAMLKQHTDEAIAAESKLKEAGFKANAIYTEQTKPALAKIQGHLQQIRKAVKDSILTDKAMLEDAQRIKRNVTALAAIAIVAAALLSIFTTRGIVRALARVITSLTEGANQVDEAAGQVAAAAQQLAEGASAQASALEQSSSALEQMASMTSANAANARQANDFAVQAHDNATQGEKTVAQLSTAMEAINDSSAQISKIIKVIEEIAFQTNLLALNAAVEAARAGEHGKGFAVVADEVRNLSQRCANAAKETTTLIEGSVDRAKEGGVVADSVAKVLAAILGDVTKVAELLNGINRASGEQAQGVEQINTAVSQVDKVTQANAAGAEESASAAQQMSAQAMTMKAMVEDLAAMVRGRQRRTVELAPKPAACAG